MCDGEVHCFDEADENPEMCHNHTCLAGWAKCADNLQCIPVSHVGATQSRFVYCDGIVDCKDKSDEDEAVCRTKTCPNSWWRCQDGLQCVPQWGSKPVRKNCILYIDIKY